MINIRLLTKGLFFSPNADELNHDIFNMTLFGPKWVYHNNRYKTVRLLEK